MSDLFEILGAILGIISFIALIHLFSIAATLKQILNVQHLILEELRKSR